MAGWSSAARMVYVILFISNANASTTQILNFPQLVRAVESGDNVKAIIHFDNCQLLDSSLQSLLAQNLDEASTRFNFTTYVHYKVKINGQLKDTVTTSMRGFAEQSTTGQLLTLFGRLSVYDDNTALLHVSYYDPVSHSKKWVVEWSCDISNGRDDNGLVLFN